MATLFIGYDLNRPEQNYTALIKRLKEFEGWWHCLDSTWLVKTDLTAVAVRDELKQLIDRNDELLVINVTGRERAWTGFDDDCSKWLKGKV